MTKRGSRIFEITADAIRKRNLCDVEAYARGSTVSKILTIHGNEDRMVSIENAHKFSKIRRHENHELHIVDGGDHNFNGPGRVEEIVTCISKFVRKHHQA